MLSGLKERLEELAVRAGFAPSSAPALGVALALVLAAVVWAALRWAPASGPEVLPARDSAVVATAVAAPSGATEPTRAAELVVYVTGAVRRPGVYRLATGSRADDAIKAAGGFTGNAAEASLNLARVLQDGEQLAVATKDEAAAGGAGAAVGGGAAGGTGGSGGSGTAPKGGAKVDLNTASAEELDTLPGIGPATAAKIVADREANGPFRAVQDLMRIPGIGAKKSDALKDLVTVR